MAHSFQSPYLPGAAKKLKSISSGTVPYISPTDLIVFKICLCGLRAEPIKRRTDARDAEALLDKETYHGPLHLSSTQRAIVEPCLADVVLYGTKTEQWWRERLGLAAAK